MAEPTEKSPRQVERLVAMRDSNKGDGSGKLLEVKSLLKSPAIDGKRQTPAAKTASPSPSKWQHKENLPPRVFCRTRSPTEDEAKARTPPKQAPSSKKKIHQSSQKRIHSATFEPISQSPCKPLPGSSPKSKRHSSESKIGVEDCPTKAPPAGPRSLRDIQAALTVSAATEVLAREAARTGLGHYGEAELEESAIFASQDLMQEVWVGEGRLSKLCKGRAQFEEQGEWPVRATVRWSFSKTELQFVCCETGKTHVTVVLTSRANAIKSKSGKSAIIKLAADSQHGEDVYAFTARKKEDVDVLAAVIEEFRSTAFEEDLAEVPPTKDRATNSVICEETKDCDAVMEVKAVEESVLLRMRVLQDKLSKAEEFFASQLSAIEDTARYRAHALEDAIEKHAESIAVRLAAAEAGARERMLQLEQDVLQSAERQRRDSTSEASDREV